MGWVRDEENVGGGKGVENGYGVANKSSPYFFFFGLEIIP